MHSTADESKSENIARMGVELGELYSALWQEVAWVHAKWAEYVELFGTNPERIELLNNTAPQFFRVVEDSLWEDILLHLSRLTDSPRSMGKDNLSVRRLPLITSLKSSSVPIDALVAAALVATDFTRDWRNRKLAHGDLGLALGLPVQPLAPASRLAVKDALQSLVVVLNAISQKYLNSQTMFQLHGANATSMLHTMRDGLRFASEKRNRVINGDTRPDDLKVNPL
jgi:hypothetical protein